MLKLEDVQQNPEVFVAPCRNYRDHHVGSYPYKDPGEPCFHVIVNFLFRLILENSLYIPTYPSTTLNPTQRPYIPHFYANYAGFYITAVSCYINWVGPAPSDRGM